MKKQKITVDNFITTSPKLLTEASVANGDYIMFLDGGATGDAKKEAEHDLATLYSGSGLTAIILVFCRYNTGK